MKSTLNEFISIVRSKGLLTSTHFFVFIPDLGDKGLMSLCNATHLPGSTIMTTEIRTFGEYSEMPHSVLYQPVTLSFYLDRDLIAKKALDQWMNLVFDKKTRKLGFYGDYTKDVSIYLTDKAQNVVYCMKLREAYPKSISDIQLDYAAESVLRIDVTFVYKFWTIEEVDDNGENVAASQQPFKASLIKGITSGNALNDYVNNNARFQQQFQRNPEGFGNSTQLLPSGLQTGYTPNNAMNFSGNLPAGLSAFGAQLGDNFSRAGATSVAAYSSSLMPGDLASQLILGSQSIARDMIGYGAGMQSLSQNLHNVVAPVSKISSSIFSLGNSLGIINNAMQTYGLGTPFSRSISLLNQQATSLSQVGALRGLPGQLSSIGAGLSATGGAFTDSLFSLRQATGFNRNAEQSVRNMTNQFMDAGMNTQNAAVEIGYRVESGELS